ncbi:hypothetical protein FACS1894125_2090 [Actinomycetota bacterium]|nr:hypothetical protein FACS1894125_2090 [Actinomycetota bacterium]
MNKVIGGISAKFAVAFAAFVLAAVVVLSGATSAHADSFAPSTSASVPTTSGSYAPSAGPISESGDKALSVSEAQVNAAAYTSYTVTGAGVTFHGIQTGRQVWIQVASTPTVVASTNPTSSELFVDAATIASSGKTGAHTLFVTNNDGTILAKAPIVISANGSLGAGNGQGGVANTSANGINPVIPAGIALIVIIGAASAVVVRRKSANI